MAKDNFNYQHPAKSLLSSPATATRPPPNVIFLIDIADAIPTLAVLTNDDAVDHASRFVDTTTTCALRTILYFYLFVDSRVTWSYQIFNRTTVTETSLPLHSCHGKEFSSSSYSDFFSLVQHASLSAVESLSGLAPKDPNINSSSAPSPLDAYAMVLRKSLADFKWLLEVPRARRSSPGRQRMRAVNSSFGAGMTASRPRDDIRTRHRYPVRIRNHVFLFGRAPGSFHDLARFDGAQLVSSAFDANPQKHSVLLLRLRDRLLGRGLLDGFLDTRTSLSWFAVSDKGPAFSFESATIHHWLFCILKVYAGTFLPQSFVNNLNGAIIPLKISLAPLRFQFADPKDCKDLLRISPENSAGNETVWSMTTFHTDFRRSDSKNSLANAEIVFETSERVEVFLKPLRLEVPIATSSFERESEMPLKEKSMPLIITILGSLVDDHISRDMIIDRNSLCSNHMAEGDDESNDLNDGDTSATFLRQNFLCFPVSDEISVGQFGRLLEQLEGGKNALLARVGYNSETSNNNSVLALLYHTGFRSAYVICVKSDAEQAVISLIGEPGADHFADSKASWNNNDLPESITEFFDAYERKSDFSSSQINTKDLFTYTLGVFDFEWEAHTVQHRSTFDEKHTGSQKLQEMKDTVSGDVNVENFRPNPKVHLVRSAYEVLEEFRLQCREVVFSDKTLTELISEAFPDLYMNLRSASAGHLNSDPDINNSRNSEAIDFIVHHLMVPLVRLDQKYRNFSIMLKTMCAQAAEDPLVSQVEPAQQMESQDLELICGWREQHWMDITTNDGITNAVNKLKITELRLQLVITLECLRLHVVERAKVPPIPETLTRRTIAEHATTEASKKRLNALGKSGKSFADLLGRSRKRKCVTDDNEKIGFGHKTHDPIRFLEDRCAEIVESMCLLESLSSVQLLDQKNPEIDKMSISADGNSFAQFAELVVVPFFGSPLSNFVPTLLAKGGFDMHKNTTIGSPRATLGSFREVSQPMPQLSKKMMNVKGRSSKPELENDIRERKRLRVESEQRTEIHDDTAQIDIKTSSDTHCDTQQNITKRSMQSRLADQLKRMKTLHGWTVRNEGKMLAQKGSSFSSIKADLKRGTDQKQNLKDLANPASRGFKRTVSDVVVATRSPKSKIRTSSQNLTNRANHPRSNTFLQQKPTFGSNYVSPRQARRNQVQQVKENIVELLSTNVTATPRRAYYVHRNIERQPLGTPREGPPDFEANLGDRSPNNCVTPKRWTREQSRTPQCSSRKFQLRESIRRRGESSQRPRVDKFTDGAEFHRSPGGLWRVTKAGTDSGQRSGGAFRKIDWGDLGAAMLDQTLQPSVLASPLSTRKARGSSRRMSLCSEGGDELELTAKVGRQTVKQFVADEFVTLGNEKNPRRLLFREKSMF
ncbi:hypothetical protein BJ742DRAFT_813373 [Cladochytrium replicatum]|nr:hypothetical protein BJ742DRAFT_813373 [Cladochytrium replicatum]